MVYKYEVWKINKIQLLKMSSKLLDSMTGTLRCDYNDNNIIMIRIITVRIIPIATISSLLSILQTLACSLISMLLWNGHYNCYFIRSDQIRSVTQSCLTLCDPMNRSTPGLPVHHQLPEFTETHIHWVSDAIQPSHLLSSPSPPAPNPSQHHSLFQWVNSSHEVAKVLEFQL